MVTFGSFADRYGRRPAFCVYSLITAASLGLLAFRWQWLAAHPSVFWVTMLFLGFGSGCTAGFGALSLCTNVGNGTFAVALASRPIDGIGRIWADGKLLRGAAGDLKAGGTLRLYLGTDHQDVDPLIAAAEGEANCPAFRGLAYVVTCEDHHWVIEDLKTKTFREPDPNLRLTSYAQTLLDHKGRAVVSSGTREEMERDVTAMHSYGLWATLQKDD